MPQAGAAGDAEYEYDVVVVGAGVMSCVVPACGGLLRRQGVPPLPLLPCTLQLAGLSTALRCLREGLRVAVVDSQCARAGWSGSASGLNCGLLEPLSADLAPPWPSLQVRLLQETSRQVCMHATVCVCVCGGGVV